MVFTKQIKFIRSITGPAIAAATLHVLDLQEVYSLYEKNFDTLIITNTSSVGIWIHLDGEKKVYLGKNNGSWSFDHDFGITYSFIELENDDAGIAVVADELKITVGRSALQ